VEANTHARLKSTMIPPASFNGADEYGPWPDSAQLVVRCTGTHISRLPVEGELPSFGVCDNLAQLATLTLRAA